MDTSPEYIKMRMAAESDLGMGEKVVLPVAYVAEDIWVDTQGNWYFFKGGPESSEAMLCQLERQDQLQAMVLPSPVFHLDPEDFDTKIDHAFWLAQDFAKSIQERKWSQQTMEQLWLGYVMRHKYGKVWLNEDWAAA